MNAKLLTDVLGGVMKLDFLEGYRTYIAAVGLLGLAVYLFTQGDYTQAVSNLSIALAALGLHEKKAEPPAVLQLPQVSVSPPANVTLYNPGE